MTGIKKTAEAIFESALKFCDQKSRYKKGALSRLILEDNWAHSTLRYALAKGIADFLSRRIKSLKAVYIHGSSIYDTAGIFSDLDLILHVTRKSRKLQKLMEELSNQISEIYWHFLGSDDHKINILDVHQIVNEEIACQNGYGALIASLNDHPILVWSRNGVKS